MKKFFKEFEEFINRGKVLNLAIGVIIGASFTAIVNSLVTDIITPILSFIIGRIDLSQLSLKIPTDNPAAPIVLSYGNFIQAVFTFLMTALCLFIIVRGVNRIIRKKEAAQAPAVPTGEEKLLAEIRDLLKEQAQR